MSSYLLAIWSDRSGNPWTRGPRDRIGHVVRVGSEQMHLVDEFTSGGPLAHVACAPACILSRLMDDGVATSMAKIEQAAGTGPQGTLFPGIESCLTQYGVANHFQGSNPPSGWIMNPAGGRLVPPSEFPAYLAASQGGCIVMDDPIVVPKPHPLPTPEEHMRLMTPGPNTGIFLLSGDLYVPISNSADEANIKASGIPLVVISAALHQTLIASSSNKGK